MSKEVYENGDIRLEIDMDLPPEQRYWLQNGIVGFWIEPLALADLYELLSAMFNDYEEPEDETEEAQADG